MEIGEVLTCPVLTVLFTTYWCQQQLPNDRSNTDRDILLSSSDVDDEYRKQSNQMFWSFSKHANPCG